MPWPPVAATFDATVSAAALRWRRQASATTEIRATVNSSPKDPGGAHGFKAEASISAILVSGVPVGHARRAGPAGHTVALSR